MKTINRITIEALTGPEAPNSDIEVFTFTMPGCVAVTNSNIKIYLELCLNFDDIHKILDFKIIETIEVN